MRSAIPVTEPLYKDRAFSCSAISFVTFYICRSFLSSLKLFELYNKQVLI